MLFCNRVLESLLFSRALLGGIFFLEDLVSSLFDLTCKCFYSFLVTFVVDTERVWLFQGLLQGGLWCCSYTKQRAGKRSMRNSDICRGGDTLILVCEVTATYFFWHKCLHRLLNWVDEFIILLSVDKKKTQCIR